MIAVRGVVYASAAAAAAAFGVTRAAVGMAKLRGRLDTLGTKHGGGQPEKPVEIRGVAYPSIAAACSALGVSRNTFVNARRRGRLDMLGTRAQLTRVAAE